LAVLEGMAEGKLIISLDIPGVRERYGKAEGIWLFPAGDWKTLATLMTYASLMRRVPTTTKERGRLMPKKIRFEWELPDETFGEGFQEEMFVAKNKEEAATRLLKERRISQGKAAELLGISRHDLFDLMAKYEIPVIAMTPEEL
jgi:predicted HTH domain antitoxin